MPRGGSKMQPFVHTEVALREVHDAITDMMKQIASEPSVGLYFVQQHVHKAVPAMISLKSQMVDKTQEAEYVTQDVKDALNSIRSMKEVGPAVIGRMIKTLDSSLPRLASLRPSKRDGHPEDTLTRTGETRDSMLIQPLEMQSSLSTSPNFSSVKQTTGDLSVSSSSSVDYQRQFDPTLSTRDSSGQVPLEEMVGHVTSEGPYTGYVKTLFDSAFQKASSVANVTKWSSFSKADSLDNFSTYVEGEFSPHNKSGGNTESSPSRYVRNILGTAYIRASSLGKTSAAPSGRTSASKDNPSLERDIHGPQEPASPSLGRDPSLIAVREVNDHTKPGQYVRVVFGSALQTTASSSREGLKSWSEDGHKASSNAGKSVEGWSWFQVPSKALRSFSTKAEKPQTEEGLLTKEPRGDIGTLDEVLDNGSKEDYQRLLDMERESYEAFAAERAAKLEDWLGDTEGDDIKETG